MCKSDLDDEMVGWLNKRQTRLNEISGIKHKSSWLKFSRSHNKVFIP